MSDRTETHGLVEAYQYGMNLIGMALLMPIRLLWRSLRGSPDNAKRRILRETTKSGQQAYELTVAFYRLYMALEVGIAPPAPGRSDGATVSLDQLRQEFLDLLPSEMAQNPYRPTSPNRPIQIDGRPVFVDVDLDQIGRAVGQVLREEIDLNGTNAIRDKNAEIDALVRRAPGTTRERETKLREDAESTAESRVAAAAEKAAKNVGRMALEKATQRDRRALGWVRVSTTGTPCGFCAMLISRSFAQLYITEGSATTTGGGDPYHENCNCIAVPVSSKQQFNSSPTFQKNREYGTLWKRLISDKGLKGKAAMSVWRKHFRTASAQQ